MRIVQVIEDFFPDSIGGTETYVLNVSKCLINAAHEVHVVAPTLSENRCYNYDGIIVHRYHFNREASKEEFINLCPPASLPLFLEVIRKINPQIVHFNTLNRIINVWNLKAVKELGIKTFLTPHISSVFCATSALLNVEGKRCDGIVRNHNCNACYNKHMGRGFATTLGLGALSMMGHIRYMLPLLPPAALVKRNRLKELKDIGRYAEAVIALSPWIKKTLEGNGVRNAVLVPQGISETVKRVDGVYEESDILRIMFVGRIFPIKSLETLCDALDMADDSRFRITMVVVGGNDEYSQNIKGRIMKHPYVDWHENVSHEDLGRLLSAQDFLVLTSISEMSPLVVLEAFACSVPVIASDIPPMADNINDGVNGRLFPTQDSKRLSQIFNEYIDNPELKYPLRKRIAAPPSFKDVSERLLEIYSQTVDES